MNVINEGYGWIVVGIIAVCLALITFMSPSMRTHIKKGCMLLLVAGGISVGYYLITGKSPTEIPSDVNYFFNKSREADSSSNRYYINPEKRYKELKE